MNSGRAIASDTSPLLSLEKIDEDYASIRQLYTIVLVPPAALRALAAGPFGSEEAYLSHLGITDLPQVEEAVDPERSETNHRATGQLQKQGRIPIRKGI